MTSSHNHFIFFIRGLVVHGVNICLVLTILLITKRLDPGWGLGQAFYTMFYYLLFLVISCILVVYVQYVILVPPVCLYVICDIQFM